MTQPNREQAAADGAAASAVMLSRLESLIAQVTEFRANFQRYTERNGERVSALELGHQQLNTLIGLTREEVKTLKDSLEQSKHEHRADLRALEATLSQAKEESQTDRRQLAERTGNLETAMNEIQDIKRMVSGQIVGLVLTVIVFGSLMAYVLLKP